MNDKGHPMRFITLEEHFATRAFVEGAGRYLAGFGPLVDQLCDLDTGRIGDMDGAGIDMQVLSLTAPGVEQLDPVAAVAAAREANEQLAVAVQKHPARLAGFATVAVAVPQEAAAELERCVHNYGFKGAVINGHVRGRYLDDSFFWPIFERRIAQSPHLPASDLSFTRSDKRGLRRQLLHRCRRAIGRRGVGLAYRHRQPSPAPHPQWPL